MEKVKKAFADIPASFVVFLVALPLCMGIAIASGVPPALGIVTGIVGGIVTGLIAGAPLQVSGPAAGLTVLVFQIVSDYGLAALGPIVFLAGLMQVAAGSARLGQWFRAVNPAVIYGMLSGIGVLIITSQIHVAFDSKPGKSPFENITTFPSVIGEVFTNSAMLAAGVLSLVTLAAMVLWDKYRPQSLKMLPAPLIAVVTATGVSAFMGLSINHVNLPSSFAQSLNIPSMDDWGVLLSCSVFTSALGLAVIASAETLLCASALRKMRADAQVGYNKELVAQGVGNAICGLVGALPMTGVIVRSTANISANAQTRWSAVFHGFWLLGLVVLFPQVLELIPMSALAAVLIYTGLKLVNPSVVKNLSRYGRPAVVIYFVTVFGIVFTNLLTGVLLGIGVSFVRLLSIFSTIKIIRESDEGKTHHLTLKGAATFLTLPKIAHTLESIPLDHYVALHFDRVFYIDASCMDLFESQMQQREAAGGELDLDSSKLEFAWKQSESGKISYPKGVDRKKAIVN